ncbi:MAG: HAMP domain-containing histidine kinase [Candidatus Cloacimonetes bacterium]|nr:HAMP domain-containing histidine kinase [Candidatus Cloacimonadota bacterium]
MRRIPAFIWLLLLLIAFEGGWLLLGGWLRPQSVDVTMHQLGKTPALAAALPSDSTALVIYDYQELCHADLYRYSADSLRSLCSKPLGGGAIRLNWQRRYGYDLPVNASLLTPAFGRWWTVVSSIEGHPSLVAIDADTTLTLETYPIPRDSLIKSMLDPYVYGKEHRFYLEIDRRSNDPVVKIYPPVRGHVSLCRITPGVLDALLPWDRRDFIASSFRKYFQESYLNRWSGNSEFERSLHNRLNRQLPRIDSEDGYQPPEDSFDDSSAILSGFARMHFHEHVLSKGSPTGYIIGATSEDSLLYVAWGGAPFLPPRMLAISAASGAIKWKWRGLQKPAGLIQLGEAPYLRLVHYPADKRQFLMPFSGGDAYRLPGNPVQNPLRHEKSLVYPTWQAGKIVLRRLFLEEERVEDTPLVFATPVAWYRDSARFVLIDASGNELRKYVLDDSLRVIEQHVGISSGIVQRVWPLADEVVLTDRLQFFDNRMRSLSQSLHHDRAIQVVSRGRTAVALFDDEPAVLLQWRFRPDPLVPLFWWLIAIEAALALLWLLLSALNRYPDDLGDGAVLWVLLGVLPVWTLRTESAPGREHVRRGLGRASLERALRQVADEVRPTGRRDWLVASRESFQVESYHEMAVLQALIHDLKNGVLEHGVALDELDERILQNDMNGLCGKEFARLRHSADDIGRRMVELSSLAHLHKLYREPVAPGELTEDVLQGLEHMQGAERLRFIAPEGLPQLMLDRTLMRMALDNLIRNALQAAGEQGDVCVELRRMGDWVEWEIVNPGSLDEEALTRIEQPGWSARPGGSGLGVPVARKIIRRHEGTLRLTSSDGQVHAMVRLRHTE